MLYRLSDSKTLSYSSNSMNFPEAINTIETKPFEQYTIEEKNIIKTELQKNMDSSIEENIKQLFTISENQQGMQASNSL